MASPIRHILLPTDGSEHALRAAGLAGELARALGAKITVLIVHPDETIQHAAWGAGAFGVAMPDTPASAEDIRGRLEQESSNNELAKTTAALGESGDGAATVQRWGHAVDEICAAAKDGGADLIVMGSHGRGAFGRALLGSVSQGVVAHAPCPVTIVR